MEMNAFVMPFKGHPVLVVNDRRVAVLPDDEQQVGRISALAWSASHGNLSAQNQILGILHDNKIDQKLEYVDEPTRTRFFKVALDWLPKGFSAENGVTVAWESPEEGWLRLVVKQGLFEEVNIDFKLTTVFTLTDVFDVDSK